MNIADTHTSNDVPASLPTSPTQRTRRNLGRVRPTTDNPMVRHDTLDGLPVVRVELTGIHGQGLEMLLTPEGWDTAQALTKWWGVARPKGGLMSVRRGLTRFQKITGQKPSSHPNLILARLLTGASGPDEIAWSINRDPFDLRESNLEVISKAEFRDRTSAWWAWREIAAEVVAAE